MTRSANNGVLASVLWKVIPPSCLALLVLWLFVGIAGGRLLNERAIENLKFAADQQTWVIADKVDNLVDRLHGIASNALTINAFLDPMSVEHFIKPFFRSLRFGDYNSLMIAMTDFSGQVVASNQTGDAVNMMPPNSLWHEAVMEGKDVLTIVDGSLIAAVPISVGALPEGGLVITMSSDDTAKLLSSEKHAGSVRLSDQDGRLLFSSIFDGVSAQSENIGESEVVALPHFPTLQLSSAVASTEQDHLVSVLHSFLLVAFFVDLAALIAGIYMAANLVASPLNKLITKIKSLQQLTDPDARLMPSGPSELQNLAHAFNDAAERQAILTKRIEEALANEQKINGLQRQFVSLVSHEFRTPLSVIDGNAQRVLRRIETIPRERIASGLEKCRGSVNRLVGLMESVLSSSRLEAGTIEFAPTPCDLFKAVSEATENQQEISSDHQIIVDVDQLPKEVVADVKLVSQIFSNLLSNAVKYSPNSSTVWVNGYQSDDMAVISVRDQGVGIPEEDLKKLFGQFFRASTAVGIPGTGIGLHLVKHLVEMHGGTIAAESIEGEGSTFTVKLPINGQSNRDALAA
ncbi:MAG: sensor histidine kinase [Geminicoccales bacterium]